MHHPRMAACLSSSSESSWSASACSVCTTVRPLLSLPASNRNLGMNSINIKKNDDQMAQTSVHIGTQQLAEHKRISLKQKLFLLYVY